MELSKPPRSAFSLGGVSTLKLVVVTGLLLLANVLASNAQFGWDASEGRMNSLADSTRTMLRALDRPVRVRVFSARFDRRAEALLERFADASSKVTYEFVDPDEKAEEAKAYNITSPGPTIVEVGKAWRRIAYLTEQNLAGAILQLAKGGYKKALFTSGHDERDMNGQDEHGMGKACTLLRGAGYTAIQSPVTDESLQEARVVVVAGARRDFTAGESAAVRKFVEDGGGLLVLLDPAPGSDLANLLAPYGIVARRTVVIERDPAFMLKDFRVDAVYLRRMMGQHPVSERITEAFVLPHCRSLEAPIERIQAQEFIPMYTSSDSSWGESDFGKGPVRFDANRDFRGRQLLALGTPEPPSRAGQGRLLVFGTSQFAVNRYLETAGNREMWEASVSWLAGDLNYPLVAIKEINKKLDMSRQQLVGAFIICVLALPGVTAVLGLIVFIRRAE